MVRKSYISKQIVKKLRKAEIMFSQKATLTLILKKIGLRDT
jgi:hypothetical protein